MTCQTCKGTGTASFRRNGYDFAEPCPDCPEGHRRRDAQEQRAAAKEAKRDKALRAERAAAGKKLVEEFARQEALKQQGKLFGKESR